MPLLAKNIPKHIRVGFAFEIIDLKLFRAFEDLWTISTRLTQPARSPLMSVTNTGMPRAVKSSASVCTVTVFPVPVAPEISPWRVAILGSKKIGSFDRAMRIGSLMLENFDFANRTAHCPAIGQKRDFLRVRCCKGVGAFVR